MSDAPGHDTTAASTPRTSERAVVPGDRGRSATERAEDLLGRFGARIGGTAADAGYRLRHAATAPRPAGTSAERADALVTRMEESIGPLLTVVGRRLQRLAARAREEMEDILAEAQHLRAQRGLRAQQQRDERGRDATSRDSDGG
jgi:hypothetical protein